MMEITVSYQDQVSIMYVLNFNTLAVTECDGYRP